MVPEMAQVTIMRPADTKAHFEPSQEDAAVANRPKRSEFGNASPLISLILLPMDPPPSLGVRCHPGRTGGRGGDKVNFEPWGIAVFGCAYAGFRSLDRGSFVSRRSPGSAGAAAAARQAAAGRNERNCRRT